MHMTGAGTRKWNDFEPNSSVHVICQFDCSNKNKQTYFVAQKPVTQKPIIQTSTLSKTKSPTSLTTAILGIVSSCTLTGNVYNFNIDGRSYCVIKEGKHRHPAAFDICKKQNARLPLPRNKKEADEFIKIGGNTWTHVDARNPKKTANKDEWVDAEGKPLGSRPVYLLGQKIKTLISDNQNQGSA